MSDAGTETGWRGQLAADGCAVLPGVLSPDEAAAALAEWADVCRRNATDPASLAGAGGIDSLYCIRP